MRTGGGVMTASNRRRVLLVEDAAPMARVYREYLREEPYQVVHAETGTGALEILDGDPPPEAVILDLKLPDMNGMDILRHVRERAVPPSVVVITAHGSINTAVEAMREGAYDFLVKPFNADRLVFTLRNALERQHLNEVVRTYRETFERSEFCGFIGSSLPMQAVYRTIDSAAPSKATVFITGESGTGKEVCADAIHQRSPRYDKTFIALNCAAIPGELMESEVFGHVKGAFTGAVAERQGAAALAAGGTLFLDEICEMDMNLQAKLLRFVQTGSYQKIGSSKVEKVDVRFVCATNREPWAEVEAGRFREDLYYRLHVIPIHLPALRERDDDVVAIARHFLVVFAREEGKAFAGISPEAEEAIAGFDWPGNVRQLQNAIRNVVVLNAGETVLPEMLPEFMAGRERTGRKPAGRPSPNPAPAPVRPVIRPMWQAEKELIEEALRACDNNVPRAAALLELSPSTLYRRLRDFEKQNDRARGKEIDTG